MSLKWKLRVSESQDQGGRGYMEDFVLIHFERLDGSVLYGVFGVMDGHGGGEAAKFVKKRMAEELKNSHRFWSNNDEDVLESIKEVYGRLQRLMWIEREKWPPTITGYKSTAGTTATVVIIRNDTLYVGHVGDSGMVLVSLNEDGILKSEQITKDHKPNDIDEKKRIESNGGSLKKKSGIVRVIWNRKKLSSTNEVEPIPFLAVARSLGDLWSYDANYNSYHVSPEPDVIAIKLDSLKHRAFILASDGVWNVVNGDTSVNLLRVCYKDDKSNPWNAANLLVNYSIYQWKKKKIRADNVSAIVVTLTPENQAYEMSDFKENNNIDILYKEILNNGLAKSFGNQRIESLINMDRVLQYPPFNISNKKLDDTDLLRMFVINSETLAQHCIPWRDDISYWHRLKISFENLGLKSFPNLISSFEHSGDRFEDLLISFSWSIICLQCIEGETSGFHKLYELPLLTDFWLSFYKKIINPNLCFIAAQLTQTSMYCMVMKYILVERETEIKSFINGNRGLIAIYSLKKSHSCNSGRLIYNRKEVSGDNVRQVYDACMALKRSSSVDVTRHMLPSVSSFNSRSDTPLMSPSNCDPSTSFNVIVNKIVRKHSFTKKCDGKLLRKRSISKTLSTKMKTILERKTVRFVMRKKPGTE